MRGVMETRWIRVGMQGIRVRMPEIRVGMRALIGVGNAGNAGIQVGNAGNQANSLWESSCLLLRLNSRSARGAFRHPAFMGSCPTTSPTFFVLSTKWMGELLCIWSYRRPGSAEGKMGYFPWLVSCRLIRLNLGVWWGREKMFCAATGKGNMSRVILGLWLWD